MTPKEKAKELFTNYLILFPEFYNDKEYGYNDNKAKQCTLIAVNEILKVLCTPHKDESEYMYWQEVKQEIELL